ncbi:hypothetical protein [Anaerotignum propionicum]|uniref:hypothetical protein n=1 Tax=Anaerotignum propionicum TaxID=28446 RepID=UPI00289836A3|nr:hypothetical protein [Anaerotignum propionicum]
MEKIVKFYKAIPEPCLGLVNDVTNSEKLLSIFEMFFDHPTSSKISYRFTLKDSNLCFDIIEKNQTFIFGKYCKVEDFVNEVFIQKRNSKDNTTGPYEPDPNELMERFTYFLIDYKLCVLVTIHNKNLPNIGKILPEFVWSASDHQLKVSILPYQIENIAEHLKKFKKCKDLTLTFANPELTDTYIPLPKVLKNCNFNSFKVHLSIKEHSESFISDLIQCKNEKSTYDSVSFTALNEYGLEDTINLMETILTKKVNIELNNDIIFNTEQIKKVLLKELTEAFTHNH